jgi:CDP-diacylglycerol--serine O-phosphatidyltransferase
VKKHIPNILTLLNLFCGCCAIVAIFSIELKTTLILLMISATCDFFDGLVARWLGIKSDFGKEVDSLADMVSFGVVPGAIVYMMLYDKTFLSTVDAPLSMDIKAMPAFIISAFSCYRLAKFNLDTRQTENFIGLATPANTMFFLGLMFIDLKNTFGLGSLVANPIFLYSLIPISSFLLISEIPMFSFKLKGTGWKGNELRFTYALLCIVLLFMFKEAAFALCVFIYILINLIIYFLQANGHEHGEEQEGPSVDYPLS